MVDVRLQMYEVIRFIVNIYIAMDAICVYSQDLWAGIWRYLHKVNMVKHCYLINC